MKNSGHTPFGGVRIEIGARRGEILASHSVWGVRIEMWLTAPSGTTSHPIRVRGLKSRQYTSCNTNAPHPIGGVRIEINK